MRRGKHVASTRLEDRAYAGEMRHEIVRMQVLDHLVADRGVVRFRRLSKLSRWTPSVTVQRREDGQPSISARARA